MRGKKNNQSVQSPVSAASEDGKHLHVRGVAVYQAYREIISPSSSICSPRNLPQWYYLAGNFFSNKPRYIFPNVKEET